MDDEARAIDLRVLDGRIADIEPTERGAEFERVDLDRPPGLDGADPFLSCGDTIQTQKLPARAAQRGTEQEVC